MATYTIREVAQRFHVQTSTLRYYEDQGLLCDVERDAHIADMLELLESRHQAILKQRAALEEAYMHVLRKLHLYRDIQHSIETGAPYPDWANYDGKDFRADDQ